MNPDDWRYRLDRARHAVQRWLLRGRVDADYHALLESWDQASFRERFRAHWDPFAGVGPAKFLDLETWLRESVFRFHLVGGDQLPRGARVLDLGAGPGYFLAVCRHHQLEVLGLDIPGEPLYDALFDFLQLPRRLHRISPGQPLPDLGGSWTLVSAFMTCFDRDEAQRPWTPDAWQYFLDDMRPRLQAGGRLVIKFNRNPLTGEFYPAACERLWRRQAGFRTRRFFDYYEFELR